jgi:hypothetical protein
MGLDKRTKALDPSDGGLWPLGDQCRVGLSTMDDDGPAN